MASIKYASFLTGIKGKQGGIVYYRSSSPIVGRMRLYVVPTYTTQNEEMGKILKNISNIWAECSQAYKDDASAYAKKFAKLPVYQDDMKLRANNSTAIFNLMLWNFQKQNEATIDLATLAFGDLGTLWPETTSIAEAVEAGYLPIVPGYDSYTAAM